MADKSKEECLLGILQTSHCNSLKSSWDLVNKFDQAVKSLKENLKGSHAQEKKGKKIVENNFLKSLFSFLNLDCFYFFFKVLI